MGVLCPAAGVKIIIPIVTHTVVGSSGRRQRSIAKIVENRLHVITVLRIYKFFDHIQGYIAHGYVGISLIAAIRPMVFPMPVLKLHGIDMTAVEEGYIAPYPLLLARFVPSSVSVAREPLPVRRYIHPYRTENLLLAFAIQAIYVDKITAKIARRGIPRPPFLSERLLFQHLGATAIADCGPFVLIEL